MASLKKRGPVYYIQFYVGTQQRRIGTESGSFQIAKEKLRQFESAEARGDSSLPSKTPIANVLTAYVTHIRATKTAKSAQTDIYYLRDAFGPICDAVKVTSRTVSEKTRKRPPKPGQDRRRKAPVIEAPCFEQINTAQVAAFISGQVASRGLAPKTANRYREILTRLFNWSMTQHGIRMPSDKNPASKVERYKEHAPEIRFLTLTQVTEQLNALADEVQTSDGAQPSSRTASHGEMPGLPVRQLNLAASRSIVALCSWLPIARVYHNRVPTVHCCLTTDERRLTLSTNNHRGYNAGDLGRKFRALRGVTSMRKSLEKTKITVEGKAKRFADRGPLPPAKTEEEIRRPRPQPLPGPEKVALPPKILPPVNFYAQYLVEWIFQQIEDAERTLGKQPTVEELAEHIGVPMVVAYGLFASIPGLGLTTTQEMRHPEPMKGPGPGKKSQLPSLKLPSIAEDDTLDTATFGGAARLLRIRKLLKDFAQIREAAREAGVSHTIINRAVKDGRITYFELAGGRKIVNIRQCKRLWAGGPQVGRPRKS